MKSSTASRDFSQSSKSPKYSLPRRSKTVIHKILRRSHRKRLDTAQSRSERGDDTPSSTDSTSPTRARPAVQTNNTSSGPEHSASDLAVQNCKQAEASTSNNTRTDIKQVSKMSLWDEACANLKRRDEDSKYVSTITGFPPFNGTLQSYFLIGLK